MGGQYAITNTFFGDIQLVKKGEVAPTHRHTTTAARFIFEGSGGWTTVEGERAMLSPGDIVFNQQMGWHDHGNDGPDDFLMFDVLDIPLLTALGTATWDFEYVKINRDKEKTAQDLRWPLNYSNNLYRAGGIVPKFVGGSRPDHSPLLSYAFETVRDTLNRLRGERGSPHDGVIVEFVNPVTGGSIGPTMSICAQLLRPGEKTLSHRHNTSTIYIGVQGNGYTLAGDRQITWSKHDIYAVPSWCWHEHGNASSEDAIVYSVSDSPVMEKLGRTASSGRRARARLSFWAGARTNSASDKRTQGRLKRSCSSARRSRYEEVAMNTSVRLVTLTFLAGALALSIGNTVGQTYPSKPIRFIVPLSAGAGDTLTRTIGQKLSETWNQPVVVENRPGAGSTIGTDLVAKAAPDGYTLLMASFSHAVNPTLYAKPPYDTLKDFAAVTLIASAPNVLTVNPSVPANSVAEVMALVKSQPGKLHFASAGNGSSSHMAGELFKNLTGAQIVHVPYKGAAPAMTPGGGRHNGVRPVAVVAGQHQGGQAESRCGNQRQTLVGAPRSTYHRRERPGLRVRSVVWPGGPGQYAKRYHWPAARRDREDPEPAGCERAGRGSRLRNT